MASGDTPTKEQIVTMYNRLSSEIREIQTKLFEIDTKMEEHELVAGALEPLPPERKCFRLIGGVLVERTVAQVLPVVRDNAKQLRGVRFLLMSACRFSAVCISPSIWG
jgi:prefoldin subunit 2